MNLRFLFFVILLPFVGLSQTFQLEGKLIDAKTEKAIRFANIRLLPSNRGTMSNEEGLFSIKVPEKTDSVEFSCLSYKKKCLPISACQTGFLVLRLETDKIALKEVLVKPEEEPIRILIRGLLKNRKKNNPNRVPFYFRNCYNKIELDLNNLPASFGKSWLPKSFRFVLNNIDTADLEGKSKLPILFSESYSDYYYRKSPRSEREIIKAYKVSGIENESLSQYTGQMYQKVNFYDNHISIFGRNFISPLSSLAQMYYTYHLTDTLSSNEGDFYRLEFKPRFKHEPTLEGNMWVEGERFSIKSIQARISNEANLNLIKDFEVSQTFKAIFTQKDTLWMLESEKMKADFKLFDKRMGILAKKEAHYSHINLSAQYGDTLFSILNTKKVDTDKQAYQLSDSLWHGLRNKPLSDSEQAIYKMNDSIKEVPLFNTFERLTKSLASGYFQKWKIEIGDYSSLYSYNKVEGNRFKLMFRTSKEWSDKFFINTHIAYGTKDEAFKYRVLLRYYFNKELTRSVGFLYKKDLEQLGISRFSIQSDNIFSAILSRTGAPNLLTNSEQIEVYSRYEWYKGVSNKLIFNYKKMSPQPYQNLSFVPKGSTEANELVDAKIILNTRIALNEQTIMGREQKMFLKSSYPVVNLNYTHGIKGFFDSQYNYDKLQLSWQHLVKVNPLGFFRYDIEMGQFFNTLPYPLLEMHKGNETYWYDDYAFNLMNYYEFISDHWLAFHLEHHFEGFFLNKIPLINRLNWREVFTLKTVWGSLSPSNRDFSVFPSFSHELKTPYVETSVGVENIFKVMRIDALFRLTHLDNENVSRFGLRVKFYFDF